MLATSRQLSPLRLRWQVLVSVLMLLLAPKAEVFGLETNDPLCSLTNLLQAARTDRFQPPGTRKMLDLQLSGRDGFGVLTALEDDRPPAVIILTAHRKHAVRAFEEGAIDYLLKPVSRENLRNALLRARAIVDSPAKPLQELHQAPHPFPERIVVRKGAASVVVSVRDILCVESAGAHCRLTTRQEVFTANESLSSLHQRLPASLFARISRFAIVNLAEVATLQPKSNGDQQLSLSNGAKLTLSRTRRTEVISVLKQSA